MTPALVDFTSELSSNRVGDRRWRSGLGAKMDDLSVDPWPEFMLPDAVAHRHRHPLYETFDEFPFDLVEDGGVGLLRGRQPGSRN